MNKSVNLIIGSGVLGAYLSVELLKKKEKVVVTTRSLKNTYTNYKFLKIQKKIKFDKLNINSKTDINKIISKYNPKKIFYFNGQSSITKSIKQNKKTLISHYNGTKNFLEILKKRKLDTKFFKANSGYIFAPKNGLINLECKFSTNKNPYIQAQQKVFRLIKKSRKYKLNSSNLIFMQIESPLRPDDFFIKKVCLGAKNKKKITVGNINTFRDYSWVTDIVKAILLTSNLKTKDYIISAGSHLSGENIIKEAYKLNGLNYKKYYSLNKKFFRKNENKFLIGSKKNISYLKNKYNFKFKIFGNKLIKEMFKSL
jgi:GDPmannose 4,6-dehydratase